jgi:hypothetical protein
MEKKFWKSPDDPGRSQFSEIDHHAIPPLTINSLAGSQPCVTTAWKILQP